MSGAPVCHIAPVEVVTPHPPVNIPSIPPAGPTLPSIAASVNAMRQVIMLISGQYGNQGPRGAPGAAAQSRKAPPARWTESVRVVETVRIFDPNDHSVFVDVERINSLGMKDKVTGEMWTWDRNRK